MLVSSPLPYKYLLAPLAGITDAPFRLICAEFGADLTFSEMVSADGLVYNYSKTSQFLFRFPREKTFSIQIFGHKPKIIGQAVTLLNDIPCCVLDFNAGCPVRKVFNGGSGSALLGNLPLLKQIMTEIRNQSRHPISLKVRLGIDSSHFVLRELVAMANDLELAFLTIHGRYRNQMFSGKADWNAIREAVSGSSVPIVGNGDISEPDEARQRLLENGCAGIMIGRGSMGNPFIFSRIKDPNAPLPTLADKLAVALRQFKLGLEYKNERRAIFEMRKHWIWYIKGEPFSHLFKQKIMELEKADEIIDYISEIIIKGEFPSP